MWTLSQSKRESIWDPKLDRYKSVNGPIVDFTASRITVGLKTVSMLNSLQIKISRKKKKYIYIYIYIYTYILYTYI